MASSRPVAPELAAIKVHGMTREAFLLRATLAAGTAYGAMSATPYITRALAQEGGGDVDILNYALTLEHLEADFYDKVINSGLVKDKKLVELAKSIGQNEQDHVDALMATVEKMGGTPAEKPKTKFEDVLDAGLDKVLQTAATVENLGAAAYLGQAPRIKNKEILAAALSIHSVEARHAAALNQLVGRGFTGANALEGSIPDGPFAMPMDMDAVLAAVKPYLA